MGRAEKPVKKREFREIVYTDEHWRMLNEKRAKAIRLMKPLYNLGIISVVHGSLARGDVKPQSDIDIVIPFPVGEGLVLGVLESSGFRVSWREIVQATPTHTPKLNIYIDQATMISMPLTDLRRNEREFYKFGGELDLKGLMNGLRVPGVDKRLMLIQPTEWGHRESSVVGREAEAARVLGISIDTVRERVRVLTRRDAVGRTGLYVKYTLKPYESVEQAIRVIELRKPGFRKRLSE